MTSEIWSINHFISFISQTAGSRTTKYHVTMPYFRGKDESVKDIMNSLCFSMLMTW